MTIEQVAEVLDNLSESCVKLGTQLWEEARSQNNAGKITRDEYKSIRSQARAIIRRSVEITTTASLEHLEGVQDSVAQLERIGSDLKKAKEKISLAEDIAKVALVAASLVTMIVASVAAPNPATIGGAVASALELLAAVGVAAS